MSTEKDDRRAVDTDESDVARITRWKERQERPSIHRRHPDLGSGVPVDHDDLTRRNWQDLRLIPRMLQRSRSPEDA